MLRRWVGPLMLVLGLALAVFLLSRVFGAYDLEHITAGVHAIDTPHLLGVAFFTACSYGCLTGFDTLAVRYVGHDLPYRRTALASLIALSIGHSLGIAALSSGAVRYRFYARWGLSAGEVARVIFFCALTVGLGLAVLAGAALVLRPSLGSEVLRVTPAVSVALGSTCLATAMLYLFLAFNRRPVLAWRGWTLPMPRPALAIGQLIVGPLNFACVAAALHQALSAVADVEYAGVAAVYVVATLTAMATHVPGGLGVIESVVVLLLPGTDLIAALVVFRVIYYLVPLVLGAATLAAIELALAWARLRPIGDDDGR
ncbi:MAG: UPF0104 family protein [Geminicoccaceae bacterium]|nr:UPF0104 family protein [Geminicoccaceae bacterium]